MYSLCRHNLDGRFICYCENCTFDVGFVVVVFRLSPAHASRIVQ